MRVRKVSWDCKGLLFVQVWATLVWNLISVVVGMMGVAYVCWLLADRLAAVPFCEKWGEGQQATRECMMHQRLLNVRSLSSSS